MKLVLVRHGETRLNRDGRIQGINDEPLNATGRAQARAISRALTHDLPFKLYTSPLARALQTAQPSSDAHETPITTVSELREADVGELDGLTIQQVRERFPEFMERWASDSGTAAMPKGESLLEAQERAWAAVVELVERHPGETVVVVTHNFVIQTLVSKALEMPLRNSRRLRLEPGSITRLEFSGERLTLTSLNETWHLRETAAGS